MSPLCRERWSSKVFFETIQMKAGTRAEEIVEAVFKVFETNKIFKMTKLIQLDITS